MALVWVMNSFSGFLEKGSEYRGDGGKAFNMPAFIPRVLSPFRTVRVLGCFGGLESQNYVVIGGVHLAVIRYCAY